MILPEASYPKKKSSAAVNNQDLVHGIRRRQQIGGEGDGGDPDANEGDSLSAPQQHVVTILPKRDGRCR